MSSKSNIVSLNSKERVKALRKNGSLLKDIPYKKRTEEECIAAVKNDYSAIEYVPDNLRTYNVCREYFMHKAFNLLIKSKFQSVEMCEAAIDAWPASIYHIRQQYPSLCKKAIKHNWTNLEYIKEEYQTQEICLFAAHIDERATKYIINPETKKFVESMLSMEKESKGN